MSDQLLPDFDGPRDIPEQPSPKKSRRKPAKRMKRAAPAPKPAKRVPKKRRVRKVASPIIAPTTDGLGASDIQIIKGVGVLLAMPREERSLVIAIVQSLPDK